MKVKALVDFKYSNNSGHFEVSKDKEVEIDDELAKDFIHHGLVEKIEEREQSIKEVPLEAPIPIEIEGKAEEKVEEEEIKPLIKIKKHKEGD